MNNESATPKPTTQVTQEAMKRAAEDMLRDVCRDSFALKYETAVALSEGYAINFSERVARWEAALSAQAQEPATQEKAPSNDEAQTPPKSPLATTCVDSTAAPSPAQDEVQDLHDCDEGYDCCDGCRHVGHVRDLGENHRQGGALECPVYCDGFHIFSEGVCRCGAEPHGKCKAEIDRLRSSRPRITREAALRLREAVEAEPHIHTTFDLEEVRRWLAAAGVEIADD